MHPVQAVGVGVGRGLGLGVGSGVGLAVASPLMTSCKYCAVVGVSVAGGLVGTGVASSWFDPMNSWSVVSSPKSPT